VAEHLVDVQSQVSMLDPADGRLLGEIPLPAAGVVAALGGREDGSDVWLMFTSPLHPATAYAFDVSAATLTPFAPAHPPLAIDRFETRQLFATSKDGTRIPLFITASRPFRRDGRAPLMRIAELADQWAFAAANTGLVESPTFEAGPLESDSDSRPDV
jgi:prolyl oligopeptidase